MRFPTGHWLGFFAVQIYLGRKVSRSHDIDHCSGGGYSQLTIGMGIEIAEPSLDISR